MKPFLGIDITTNKKNEEINGSEFIVARTSAAMEHALERAEEQADETIEKSKLPLPLRIGYWICGIVTFTIAIGIMRALNSEDSVSLATAYQNAPWLFWAGGACLVIWLILKLVSSLKEKAVFEDEENTHVFSTLGGVCDAIFTELAVPADAKEVDVLSFFYVVKDGVVKAREKGLSLSTYLNPIFRIYADADTLYLANLEVKYAFPRSSLRAIHTVKKSTRIAEWNKDEDHTEGEYKKYKIVEDKYGVIQCKPYHILEIDGTEPYGIYFPCYELPVFEEITGLKAE